jgi:SSS family solute:Na+ symporter
MRNPVVLPVDDQIELESSKGAKIVGVGVVIATIALYAVFW